MSRRALTTALALVSLLALRSAAGATGSGLAAPFATLSSQCTGSNMLTLPATAGAHSGFLLHLGTSATATLDIGPLALKANGGDSVWLLAAAAYDPAQPATVACPAPAQVSAEWYDLPAPPATISGATTGSQTETIGLLPAYSALYAADVQVSGGALTVTANGLSQHFTSTRAMSFGSLHGGNPAKVTLSAAGRPQVNWAVGFRALQVRVTTPSAKRIWVRAGRPAWIPFTLTADATVDAQVNGPSGKLLALASASALAAGKHSFGWNGHTDAGLAAAEGRYSLQIGAADPGGGTTQAQLPLGVDLHSPTVSLKRRPGGVYAPLIAQTADVGSGVASASLVVDGRQVARSKRRLAFIPDAGWKPGRHAYAITVTDAAGNQKLLRGSFTVPAPPPPTVTMISDSVGTALNYNAAARAFLAAGYRFNFDLHVCRRLISAGCGTEGPPPPNALETIRARGSSLGQILVVFVGYNDDTAIYATGIGQIMHAALADGAQQVIWLTLSERRPYYASMNAELRAAAARYKQLTVADWNAYGARHSGWFAKDGLHLDGAGADGLAHLIRPALDAAADKVRRAQAAAARRTS